MSNAKRIVMLAAAALFAVWLTVYWDRVTGDADASIRFTLGILFAVLVIFRRKDEASQRLRIPDAVFPISLVAGVLAALLGIVFRIHMLEWSGVLLLLLACSFWVSPARFRMDLILAFTVLFWVHPIPGQIFGVLQGAMQRLSVTGSESVLHVFNVRVWGDGIILRAGYKNFLVPEACSGMRTSVTVFLCALGVGMLLRLRWWETLGFIVLGLAQVLLLNIVRISYLVLWAPRMPPEWAENFLHDTLGIFLLAAIVLVQMEAAWWRWWSRRRAFIREGIRKKELEGPDKASIIPHSLRVLVMALAVLVGVGLIAFGVFAFIYKNRAYHRKEMIREVAVALMETDPASAHRALVQIRQTFPLDTELIALQANTEFILGRFEEGLALLDEMVRKGGTLGLSETVVKGWALMRTGKLKEARELIDSLPVAYDRIPGVAMLKAEFAAMDGLPAEAARHLEAASGSHLMLPRIRGLFPYLAQHEQWLAITKADLDRPYTEFSHALIALYANQQVNNLSGLTRVMGQALKRWPDDPRLLSALFEIASRQQSAEWEGHFERNFRANVGKLAADSLSAAAGYCWRLMRPDLAWLAYVNLNRVVPGDPELLMAPARYGAIWTRLRRRQLAVQSDTADRTIDLLPILNLFAKVRPLSDIRRRIPLLEEASVAGVSRHAANQVFERGLAELERREAEGPLGGRLMRLYPMTLALLNRYDEAHVRLDRIREAYPDQALDVLFQHAVFYDQQTEWQKSYEMLEECRQLQPSSNLTVDLLKISALMNLNLGVCAMEVLDKARITFSGAARLDLAEAAIWDVFGYKAQALHVLTKSPGGESSPMAVELLSATGRLAEAQRLSGVLGLSTPEGAEPTMWLPPAPLLLTPRWPPPPKAEEISKILASLQAAHEKASSPFIKALRGMGMAWMDRLLRGPYELTSESEISALVSTWEAVGRTPLECLGGVYELAMLAARQGDVPLAMAAVRRGIELAPDSAVLWRVLCVLSAGEAKVVQDAELHCPSDPEIFLMGLVTAIKGADDEDLRRAVALQRVERVEIDGVFPPETLIQTGDFLLTEKMPDLAARLARVVVPRARGLLAAHVLALRAALMTGDTDWALASAVSGIELARDPVPFYRVMVDVKVARQQVDNDLLSALEYLKSHQSDDPRWAEELGSLYFQRGDLRRALTIFGSVIDTDIKGAQVRTLLLAAEAARLDSKNERAVSILEAAYALRPGEVGILNNLVYQLAQNPKTLPRARLLLPKLLEMGEGIFAVMDTAAMVASRGGNAEQARVWMEKALSLLKDGEYGALEVRLNAAELKIQSGDVEMAREALMNIRLQPGRSEFIDQRARLLIREIDTIKSDAR